MDKKCWTNQSRLVILVQDQNQVRYIALLNIYEQLEVVHIQSNADANQFWNKPQFLPFFNQHIMIRELGNERIDLVLDSDLGYTFLDSFLCPRISPANIKVWKLFKDLLKDLLSLI